MNTKEDEDPPDGVNGTKNRSSKEAFKILQSDLTIAFLYNVRHIYPDSTDPTGQLEADFDDPATIEAMINNLNRCGFKKIIPIEAKAEGVSKLLKYRHEIDLVFNYSEGFLGRDRECHIPALLEMLNIPYTGSSPLIQAICFDKGRTKQILIANKIPTLPFQIFKTGKEKLFEYLKFPLIVKPIANGSSAGITNDSVVNDNKSLMERISFIIKTFNQDALVEKFIDGREFSVPMWGNPPEILPIIEPNHKMLPEGYKPIDSLEVKWMFEEEVGDKYFSCPAKIGGPLRKKIEDLCLRTWRVLNIFDWCRIDVRCDRDNNPYIIEVNTPPGSIPPEISTTSYFPFAARQLGIDYLEYLKKIILIAWKRYEKQD
jgi:D-alanine-D-alanine ligase